MPAVATVSDLFHVLAASTTEQTFVVPGNDGFTLVHDGVNSAGSADENPVYLRLNAELAAVAHVGGNLIKLMFGRSVFVAGGPHTVHFLCASGAPTFTIARRR